MIHILALALRHVIHSLALALRHDSYLCHRPTTVDNNQISHGYNTDSHIGALAMKLTFLGHKRKVDLLSIRTVADLIIAYSRYIIIMKLRLDDVNV